MSRQKRGKEGTGGLAAAAGAREARQANPQKVIAYGMSRGRAGLDTADDETHAKQGARRVSVT